MRLSEENRALTFVPAETLPLATNYQFHLSELRDAGGNPLAVTRNHEHSTPALVGQVDDIPGLRGLALNRKVTENLDGTIEEKTTLVASVRRFVTTAGDLRTHK